MKIIKDVSQDIESALDLAEHYAKQAILLETNYPALAQHYLGASSQVLDIMKNFHNDIVNIINDYRKTEGEPPAPMQVMYDYIHERLINKAAAVKNLQTMFKQ